MKSKRNDGKIHLYISAASLPQYEGQTSFKNKRNTFEAGLIINLVEKNFVARYSHTFYNALLTTRIHPSDYVSVKGTEVQKVYRNIIFPYIVAEQKMEGSCR